MGSFRKLVPPIGVNMKSKSELRALVNELDLRPIAFKLSESLKWPLEKINHAIAQYRLWLTLVGLYPNTPIPPSSDIDEVWHYHILDTQKYVVDCQTVFGYFVHHFPYFGLRGADDKVELNAAFGHAQTLLMEEFQTAFVNYDSLLVVSLCGPENCCPTPPCKSPGVSVTSCRPLLEEDGTRTVENRTLELV